MSRSVYEPRRHGGTESHSLILRVSVTPWLGIARLLLASFACVSMMAAAPAAQQKVNPRDLTGIWLRSGGDRSISPKAPPLTAEGEARMAKNIPVRSRNPRTPSAANPAESNDPAFACNPKGFPRILVDIAHDFHEMIDTRNGRLLQLWQEERRPREIWLDGRPVPSGENLDNLGPSWYGHSVGRWEGNTLVVTTVGLDDRAWIDVFGYPKSAEARIEERYRRVDADTMEVRLTLFDPKYYTQPWVSDAKIFKRQPREKVTFSGWYGLFSGVGELICAPMNANPISIKGGD
jgi:hypothetical protein